MQSQNELIGGRYRLHSKIGEGGMGVVWRAADRLVGETVALKQVKTPARNLHSSSQGQDSERELRLALAREFQILAGLRHPHIISVLDYGFDREGRPYFTMEYLPNSQALLAAAADQPLDVQIGLLLECLQALAYLHQQGILHRDLKPCNVLVDRGHVRVLDFGLAAARGDAGISSGTLAYMAPEVVESNTATEAADLYAVGVMAYELMAGQHPFAAEDLDLFLDRILDETADLTLLQVAGHEQLRRVVGRLLAKQPEARYGSAREAMAAFSAAVGRATPPESPALRESFLQAAKFVGRHEELNCLMAALDAAITGRGSAWLVGGESGVGKSRLLAELRIRALVSGAMVVTGQAVAEGGLVYHALREPLMRLALVAEVDDIQARVLKALLPNVDRLLGQPVAAPAELGGEAGRQRLLGAITTLFRRLPGPALLVLEDLHWATESREVLRRLNRLVGDLPLLIVGSYRNDEQPDLPDNLPGMNLITLERLDGESIAELSAAMLGAAGVEPRVLHFLQEESEGNTFFLVEVVRALAEEVGRLSDIGSMVLPQTIFPRGIHSIVRRRLAQVPDWAHRLLQLTAVAGRQLDPLLLRQLYQHTPTSSDSGRTLGDWLAACAAAAVIEAQEERWRFVHDKLREGLLLDLSPADRVAAHREVGHAIEQLYAGEPEQAATLAYHFHMAGEVEAERHYARLAGEYVAARFAHSEAILFFSRALELTPVTDFENRFSLLLTREEMYHLRGDREEQQRDLETLESLADRGDATAAARRADVSWRRSRYAMAVSDYPAALTAAEQAVAWARVAQDARWEAEAFLQWGNTLEAQGNYEAARGKLEQSLALARVAGMADLEARALRYLGWVSVRQGHLQAEAEGQAALILFRQLGDRAQECATLNGLGYVFFGRGDYAGAISCFEQALAIAREMGNRGGESVVLTGLGQSLAYRGEFAKAIIHYRQAITIKHELGDRGGEASLCNNSGWAYFGCGDRATARRWYERALSLSREVGNRSLEGVILCNLGLLSHHQGEGTAALEYSQAGLRLIRDCGHTSQEGYALTVLAHAMLDLGQVDEAAATYREAVGRWQALNMPLRATAPLAGLAWLALKTGDRAGAVAQVEKILPYLEKSNVEGTEEPLRIFWTCYRVLQSNQDARAEALLAVAYRLLQERADRVGDDDLRRSLLENVAGHRQIEAGWAEAGRTHRSTRSSA
jgi:predicted ATPase/tRNA A-37 threonylcarbamoyl transferase component Bud32